MAQATNGENVKGHTSLIIPAGGSSKRFPNMRPKWMLTHPHGRLMIEEVIAGLDIEFYDECHIVILKQHCEQYDADQVIKQALGDKFKVTILDEQTSCSPETVYECIKRNNIQGQIVVKDCDCLVEFNNANSENYVVGLDIHNQPIRNLVSKSFIKLDVNELISSIVEKQVVSDIVCLGVYSIDSKIFVDSYEKLIKVVDQTRLGEIYLSHVVSDAILRGHKFNYVTCDKYIDWGTADEWFKYTSSLKTYIFDIDGVLLKNVGKYGAKNWSNFFEPLEENIQVLKDLSNKGAEIIFITSRTEEYLHEFKSYLNVIGVRYKTIISGCNHNKRIIINDHSHTNPYPSCESISLPRNANIEDYL